MQSKSGERYPDTGQENSLHSRRVLNLPGKLCDIYTSCGGNAQHELHDALADSRALTFILSAKSITMDAIIAKSRSLESVHVAKTNPFLKAKLITPLVAHLITPISCQEYLNMSDEDLIAYLKRHGVKKVSITACLKKRLVLKNRKQ